jgi:penicillin-binding protein 1A
MTSVMQDVIKTGTAKDARTLGRQDLAGKTGTTNQEVDTWFNGFNSNLVTTVWIGYDQPLSIREYAAKAALPIWMTFMRLALKDQPEASMPQPAGIVSVRIDKSTGLLAGPKDGNTLFELFRKDNVPTQVTSGESSEQGAESEINRLY